MSKESMKPRELARRLTEEGVQSDRFKVMRWARQREEHRRIDPEAAAALDRIFGTVHVFDQFAYDPHVRSATRSLLEAEIEAYLADLERRIRRLEKGSQ